MEIVFLGTGSPIPDPNRAGPAMLVKAGPHHLLFDAGRGVVMRMAGAGTGPALLTRVFLTHLHSDHTTDLNDVITTRWVMSPVENPLSVVGPVGTAGYVERTLAMLSDDVSYRLAHHEDLTWSPSVDVDEVDDGVVFEADGVRVIAAPTDHAPVHPTVGYRIEHDGRSLVLAGDTVPCAGLDRLCAGADVYVQTVLRQSLVESVPMQRFKDTIDYHSTTFQTGETAARGSVGTVVLTHMVPGPFPGTEHEWVAEVNEAYDGPVVIAEDLMTLEV
jgi:ribonuclease Z